MSKEKEKITELIEVDENGNIEDKKEEEKKPEKSKVIPYTIMAIILLAIAIFGCYYAYYQYNRMEEINSKK